MEKREASEDLHDRGERVEAEEDIEMDRILPWDALAVRDSQGTRLLGQPTVSHLVQFLAPCHVCRLIHRQPIRPLHQPNARRIGPQFLHLRNKEIHVFMHHGLQSPD